METRIQSEYRAHLIGQEKKVTYIKLMESTLKHAIRCSLLFVLKITIGYTLYSLLW